MYILLAPYNNEQSDLIHRINQTRELELIPDYKELLELFINQEIIPWKAVILQKYELLFRHAIQASQLSNVNFIVLIKKLENLKRKLFIKKNLK